MSNNDNPLDWLNIDNPYKSMQLPDNLDEIDMRHIFQMHKECADRFDMDTLIDCREMLTQVLFEESNEREFNMYSQMLLYINQRIDKLVNEQVTNATRGQP